MRFYIVETAENIPYDVTEVRLAKGMEYIQAIADNAPNIQAVYSNNNAKEPFAYVKWLGELGREYCATLITVIR